MAGHFQQVTDLVGHDCAQDVAPAGEVTGFEVQRAVKVRPSDRIELAADEGVPQTVVTPARVLRHFFGEDAHLEVEWGERLRAGRIPGHFPLPGCAV
jgi:hypothetical protein